MADDKKNIGPEAEKPGEAPQEKKAEPVKDTPPAPEQPAPGTAETPVGETATAPTVENQPEEKAAPAPKVLDFSAAKNKAPAKEETAPEKKPAKEQAAEKAKRGRPAKTDKAAPAEKPKQPRDKMSQSKKAPGKEAPIPPKPEAAPKEAKPFVDPQFSNNVILTGTEFLTMNTRPKVPANARNLNCCIIGSSGSGKTRFWLTPQLLQAHSSYVCVDPNGNLQ